jgi:hypothetical protein
MKIKSVWGGFGLTPVLLWICLNATARAQAPNAMDPALNDVLSGNPKLACSLVSGYGAAGRAGVHAREMQALYEVGDWVNLATMVSSIGSGMDNFWYVLGRSVESLGQWELAQKYYKNSLNVKTGCHCMGRVCLTSANVHQLVSDRIGEIDKVQEQWSTWSDDQRNVYLSGELKRHVAFYACLRWADDDSIADLNQNLTVGSANAVEALTRLQQSKGTSADSSGRMGILPAAANAVYRQVHVPQDRPARGASKESSVRECMTRNGMIVAGNVLDPSAWRVAPAAEASTTSP